MVKLVLLLFLVTNSYATDVFNVEDKVLIEGFDPVSYLKDGKATEGLRTIKTNYKNIVIHFASNENRELFEKSPSKYIPKYNGWCAYAMSDSGDLVTVNPKAFKVINGKTYLFYKNFFVNTLNKWNNSDEKKLIEKADINWKKI